MIMADIVTITCPHCGGQVDRVDNAFFAKCPYCGIEVAFNEIKEEVQVGEYRERIDTLEHNENVDRQKRLTMQKWVLLRNIVLGALSFTNFMGFLLVGSVNMSGNEGPLGFGSILFLITIGGFLIAIPALSVNYPGYNALYRKEEKFGKVRMFFQLGGVGLALLLVSAMLAYIVLRFIYE